MNLAGVNVRKEHVETLIRLLDPSEPLAQKLNLALRQHSAIVALTLQDRVRLLEALDEPPKGLGPLRDTLAEQFRRRNDLAARLERERYRS